jgi:hypothetical protein
MPGLDAVASALCVLRLALRAVQDDGDFWFADTVQAQRRVRKLAMDGYRTLGWIAPQLSGQGFSGAFNAGHDARRSGAAAIQAAQ